MTSLIVEDVDLGDRSYQVIIGRGATAELASLIPTNARRAAIVTQPDLGISVDPGIESKVFEMGDGEAYKSLSTVESLCSSFAEWGLTRGDVVVAVGGGIVTDVAGFAAASYHRGVPVVHVSTTLLGQIDAAIGGKTGVNLPQGKNLVGAFWQPHGVICDTAHLDTLSPRDYKAGLGEIAKYHFLGGGQLDKLPIDERVARCVRIKADVVAADEREGGRRAILNYGHTLAHALEIDGGFDWRHGEAVAVGVRYAGEVAYRLGRIDDDRLAEHWRVLDAYELKKYVPAGADFEALIALFSRDKKAIDGVTFVLDGPDGVEPVTGIDEDLLVDAMAAMIDPTGSVTTKLSSGPRDL